MAISFGQIRLALDSESESRPKFTHTQVFIYFCDLL